MKIHFAVNSPELSWIHHSDWTWANCPEGPEARVPAHFDAARIRPLRGANAGSKECKVCCSHMHIESTHFPTDHHSYTDTLSVWKYMLLIHYLIRASVHLKETTLFNPQNVCVAPQRYMHLQVVLLDKKHVKQRWLCQMPMSSHIWSIALLGGASSKTNYSSLWSSLERNSACLSYRRLMSLFEWAAWGVWTRMITTFKLHGT